MRQAAMVRLWFWLISLRGAGWFAWFPGPLPLTWQGWSLWLGFIVAIVATIFLPDGPGWAVRVACTLVFFGVSFWTAEWDGRR